MEVLRAMEGRVIVRTWVILRPISTDIRIRLIPATILRCSTLLAAHAIHALPNSQREGHSCLPTEFSQRQRRDRDLCEYLRTEYMIMALVRLSKQSRPLLNKPNYMSARKSRSPTQGASTCSKDDAAGLQERLSP